MILCPGCAKSSFQIINEELDTSGMYFRISCRSCGELLCRARYNIELRMMELPEPAGPEPATERRIKI